MIERHTSADLANAVINHDDVRPFVSFDDTVLPMDLGQVVADDLNMLLMAPNGGFLFVPKREDLEAYELHTFFLPIGRGRELVVAAHEAFEWMFVKTPAVRIYTYTPDDCPHATPPLSFGWRPYFRRDALFTRGGKAVGAEFWRLDFWDWAAKQKRIVGLESVLKLVAEIQARKARRLASEWFEWTGEDITCR